MAMQKITDDRLLALIVDFTQKQGTATIREIAAAAGISSSSTAWHRIDRLRQRGLVEPGRRVRASGVGLAMANTDPEIFNFDLQVRIDPSAGDPVSVVLVPK